MKRTPIVAVATVAGLVGVLAFHTKAAPLTLGIASSTTGSKESSTGSVAAASSPSGRSGEGSSSSTPTTSPGTTTRSASTRSPSTSTTTTPSTSRTVTGLSVNYNYGVLSVSVTATGTKITSVRIASLDDGGNFRSQSIDQESIPVLEQEALQAQSANIQGVSGASYTSAGFEQSLQSALNELRIS